MLNLFKQHWRILAGAVALLIAFAFGRFVTPPKTVTVTKVETVEKVVTKTVTLQAKERVVYRDRTVIQKPDGTVEHRDIERTEQDTQTATGTEHDQEHATATATAKTVTPTLPQWRASLLAGVDVLHLNQPQILGPVLLGGMVERRLVGPLWVGAWGLSSGVGGLALSVEF